MGSITSWVRLEPRCRDDDMTEAVQRTRLRSAVAAGAAMADGRVPGRGHRHAGARALARREQRPITRYFAGAIKPDTQLSAPTVRRARRCRSKRWSSASRCAQADERGSLRLAP